MSGVGLQITLNSAPLQGALARLAERGEQRLGLMEQIGAALLLSTQMRFEAERGPDGNPWPPSIRALAEGGKTLRDDGQLVGSLTYSATNEGVEIGTNVIYAAIHQQGGTIKAKSADNLTFRIGDRWISKAEVTIPARPFLGIDDDDMTEIAAILSDYLAGAA